VYQVEEEVELAIWTWRSEEKRHIPH
jgi:hypothetical protein